MKAMPTRKKEEDSYDLLSLLQLSDSFFPLGGYALSFGLETFSQRVAIRGEGEIFTLLSVFVEQLSTSDCPAMRTAYRAAVDSDLGLLLSVDRRLASFKNVKEFYEASKRTGRALLRTFRAFAPSSSKLLTEYSVGVEAGRSPGLYPVCLGLVCHELGIAEESAVSLMIYTLSVNILGAAIRLGHITHVEAQRILHLSKKVAQQAARESSAVSWERMRTFCPTLDIMGMQHAYLSPKMFAC